MSIDTGALVVVCIDIITADVTVGYYALNLNKQAFAGVVGCNVILCIVKARYVDFVAAY